MWNDLHLYVANNILDTKKVGIEELEMNQRLSRIHEGFRKDLGDFLRINQAEMALWFNKDKIPRYLQSTLAFDHYSVTQPRW